MSFSQNATEAQPQWANAIWIDDSRLANKSDVGNYVADVDGGKVLHGPIDGNLGHNSHDHKILLGMADLNVRSDLTISNRFTILGHQRDHHQGYEAQRNRNNRGIIERYERRIRG